jgi:hypothetical protein
VIGVVLTAIGGMMCIVGAAAIYYAFFNIGEMLFGSMDKRVVEWYYGIGCTHYRTSIACGVLHASMASFLVMVGVSGACLMWTGVECTRYTYNQAAGRPKLNEQAKN